MIRISNLTMDYGSGPILSNVNLHIEKGEAVVIIGGSGCGKSTLLRCMNRLITPTSGEVLIEGKSILDKNADLDGIRSKMGMVYQHFNLFSHMTVLDNVILAPMQVLHKTREEAKDDAMQLLEKVGMGGKSDRMPGELSGGQKQRVAIARTLAMHPDLILFDEPTSALDPTMVDEVESVIRDLINEGMTSVIVTHEMNFAKNIASRVLFLAEQGIYEEGTPEEIFEYPKRTLTRQFLYRSHMLEHTLDAEHLDLYSLASTLRTFLQKFEKTSAHDRLISAFCDELIAPVMKETDAGCATVRLICSRTSADHMLLASFPHLTEDPLSRIDDLNLKLLEHYASFVFSRPSAESGYEVCIQM